MGSFSRRTRICVVGLLFASGRNAEALQNLFNAIQGGGSSAPAPLCKRVDVGTLSVSPMGLGTLNLPLDKEVDDDANDVLKAAVECDINFVDTAEAYGFGKSETLLKNACDGSKLTIGSDTGSSGSIAAATKFAPVPWRTESQTVVDACKASASRLGVEQIPLYQIHFPDIIQPLKAFGRENRKDELYWEGLAECYQSGLAANVGVSNYGPETLLRAQDALSKKGVPIVSNQINLSLLHYRSSEKTLKICDELGIKVLAYFPLANGLLAGKYSIDSPPSFPKSLTMKKYYEDAEPVLVVMRRIAAERNKTVAQVAINWVMMKGAIPIPGARNSDMARDNFGSMGWALSPTEVAELEMVASKTGEFSNGGFELV
ncbi:unnamed protein product [Pseudo-nitzschia multistriata]|uniref:NADP-dependent oxidoreductase domain-containing protein n=1 Tax=Pseudo-nitzschia multistriata TaxID=183589 RepID=A0A448YZE5_9STRA|nr:unnamed protein product [Pseudo-nitzschia multistriata]